jgi:oligopeptide/dipeptide ABC transporter ATP-binding protein
LTEPIVEAHDLEKHFKVRTSIFETMRAKKASIVRAVDGINLQIMPQQVLGLVGESGCGKTTTGKIFVKLLEPTKGKVLFKGFDVTSLSQSEMKTFRRKVQMVFQDPYASLNPRMSVLDIILEPIRNLRITDSAGKSLELVSSVLEELDLVPPEDFLLRFPHELSGGQRQRIAVARAFVLDPEFIVADEPTSMLDASVRSEVLKLVSKLIDKTKCAFLYITHDIALARHICNRIAVMYLGKIVEVGPSEEVVLAPTHPYSKALVAAVPVPNPKVVREGFPLREGTFLNPVDMMKGCRFHNRCPYAREICILDAPELDETKREHYVACHFPQL